MKFNKLIVDRRLADLPPYPVGRNLIETRNVAKNMALSIEQHFPYGDIHLWVSGSSGSILGTLIAAHIDRVTTIHYIKKPGESRHSGNGELITGNPVHIIVDDFIGTGETVNRIYRAFKEQAYASVNILVNGGIEDYGLLDDAEFDTLISARFDKALVMQARKEEALVNMPAIF